MTGLGSFAQGLANGINTGLGMYQQGQVLKQQGIEDDARQAGVKHLEGVKQAFVAGGGNEADFKPGVHDLLGAYEATAAAHAEKGDFNGYSKAIAATEPLRQRARVQAWQAYQMDGDAGKLGAAFYSTIPDGVKVEKYDLVNGAGPDGKAADPQVRFQLSNGRTVMFKPAEVEGFVKRSLVDPTKAAEIDAKLAAELFKIKADTAGKVEVEGVKGKEARKTEDVKAGYKREEIGLTNAGNMDVARERTRGQIGAAQIHAGATLGAAGISAGATRDAATIRADADLRKPVVYGSDQSVGLFSATPGGGREFKTVASGGGKRMTTQQLLDAATHQFGEASQGPLGGSRIGGEKVAAIAARANDIRTKNPNIPDDQALLTAAGEFGVKFPRATGPVLGLSSAQPAAADGWSITRE